MRFLKQSVLPFFISWLITFLLASLFHSQYIVNQLVNVGVVIKFNDRVDLTLHDWIALLPTYGIIIAIVFLIAFTVTAFIIKKFKQLHIQLFIVAGVVSFALMLIAIESLMNINIIAGARGWGFYAQLFAGAMGGLAFGKLSEVKHNQRQNWADMN